jgi:Tfp pilus assembly protein FimT
VFQVSTEYGDRAENEAAFTLIEVLVVCLLISIILSVGIPALHDSLLTNQLKATSRKIISTVQGLRNEAIRSRQSFTLFIDLDGNRMWHKPDESITTKDRQRSVKDITVFPSSIHVVDVWSKSMGKQSQGTKTLWITPQGYMDMTVFHITDGGETISILISPFLGSIRVVDGYADLEQVQ